MDKAIQKMIRGFRHFRKTYFSDEPALSDLEKLGERDPMWAELDAIVKKNNGLWCAEAEQYLLQNAPRRK